MYHRVIGHAKDERVLSRDRVASLFAPSSSILYAASGLLSHTRLG
jgi:hypothetical protein